MSNNKIRIIVRREFSGKSTFTQSDFTIKLMMGFIAIKPIKETENEILFEIEQSNDLEHRDLKEVRILSETKEDIVSLLSEIKQKIKKFNKSYKHHRTSVL